MFKILYRNFLGILAGIAAYFIIVIINSFTTYSILYEAPVYFKTFFQIILRIFGYFVSGAICNEVCLPNKLNIKIGTIIIGLILITLGLLSFAYNTNKLFFTIMEGVGFIAAGIFSIYISNKDLEMFR